MVGILSTDVTTGHEMAVVMVPAHLGLQQLRQSCQYVMLHSRRKIALEHARRLATLIDTGAMR